MEKLTDTERCWLLGHLRQVVAEYKKATGLFDGTGSDDGAIRQAIEDDVKVAQDIVHKLGGH